MGFLNFSFCFLFILIRLVNCDTNDDEKHVNFTTYVILTSLLSVLTVFSCISVCFCWYFILTSRKNIKDKYGFDLTKMVG